MGGINNVDYSTLTVSDTAQVVSTAASPAMPGQTHGAVITVEDAPIRWRDDGTAPTATEGHLLNVGDVLSFDSWTTPKADWRQVLRAIQAIRATATSGKLKISWYD